MSVEAGLASAWEVSEEVAAAVAWNVSVDAGRAPDSEDSGEVAAASWEVSVEAEMATV